jgi:organic hydroperoxide reductase OsmC/OhrA
MTPARDGTVRHGTVRWLSQPPRGVARLRVGSDAFTALPLSAPEGEPKPGETTPGELLAATCAAFMAAKLAQGLERDGAPASELVVQAWCLLSADVEVRALKGLDVKVLGRCSGLDDAGFRSAARAALASCRESLGIRSDLHMRLRASLAQ